MRPSTQEPGQEAAEPRLFRQAAEGDRRALEPRLIRQQRRGTEVHACLLALLLVGCKHVSELQVQQHQEAASAATTETHEVRESGPEIIALTLDEYAQLCPGAADPPAPTGTGGSPERLSSADGRPAELRPATITQGPVLRHLEAVIYRGPSLDDLRSLSSLQSKVNTALAVHEEKKSGPAGLLGLLGASWPLILIGGAILAGLVAFKLKPPWLSFLFKLLGRAP